MIANMRILLVEDNEKTANSMLSALSEMGCTIDWRKNGLSGLEQAQNSDYDLYIIDHLMPLMNGIQLVKNLKSGCETLNIPIIFITTKDEKEVKSLPEFPLFNYVLAKPIAPSLLCDTVAHHFRENSASFPISK